jgi:hypothetical protein
MGLARELGRAAAAVGALGAWAALAVVLAGVGPDVSSRGDHVERFDGPGAPLGLQEGTRLVPGTVPFGGPVPDRERVVHAGDREEAGGQQDRLASARRGRPYRRRGS